MNNVNDTISRQAAIDIAYKYRADIIAEEIEDLSTAQSEIIRCKDCKYGEFHAHNVRCSQFYGAGCYNGFCAWGEKK